ncbi:MAG TPA: hypothetical protein VFI42_12915 [Thermomicrobiaceae bacterium]|nr:hypothetical protein [Thermomicrobiaceae bacterium]
MATRSQKPRAKVKTKAKRRFHRRADGQFVSPRVRAWQIREAYMRQLRHGVEQAIMGSLR